MARKSWWLFNAHPDNALSIDALHGYLDGKLARFKWPKMLQILDALPREDTGKIFKNKLRAQFVNKRNR